MFSWQGSGARVSVTDRTLVIDRAGPQARRFGSHRSVSLDYLAGFHTRQPTRLTPGWIQLCIGVLDPPHHRDIARCDPHTVLFTRDQLDQMTDLTRYLQNLSDDVHPETPSTTTSTSWTSTSRTSTSWTPPALTAPPNAIPPDPDPDSDPDHPLHGQTVVITGVLADRERIEAWAQLASRGARIETTVTRATTIVVAGTWIDEHGRPKTTRNLDTARRLRAAGQPITMVDGPRFDDLLAGDRAVLPATAATAATIDPYALADDSGIAPGHRTDPLQQVRGRHHSAWGHTIRQLIDDHRTGEALELLLDVVAVAERPENCDGGAPTPVWTEQAADLYRTTGDHVGEVVVLQRWFDAATRNGYQVDETHPFVQRIATARRLLDGSFRHDRSPSPPKRNEPRPGP